MKKIAVVIPALEKNRYSDNGDLTKFGNMTLLEWKINQLKALKDICNIYISTPSEKIAEEYKEYGEIILRKTENFSEGVYETVEKIKENTILWTNATAPFISEKIYKDTIKKYQELDKNKYDSLVTVTELKDYMVFKDEPLNFEKESHTERVNVEPVLRLTNGIFIFDKSMALKYKKIIGLVPFYFKIDSFCGYEIFSADDHTIANDLITAYFKKNI